MLSTSEKRMRLENSKITLRRQYVWWRLSAAMQDGALKDKRDVPQLNIIFLDISFLIYLHLNLLIPRNLGYITRLLFELEYLELSLK